MRFTDLSTAVAQQFQSMVATGLYRVRIVGQDAGEQGPSKVHPLWTTYLESFPPEANPRYVTRTEHDCSCCRSFIKTLGSVVTIRDGQLVTLWDTTVPGAYQIVVDTMAAFVRAAALANGISNVFVHGEKTVGVAKTRQLFTDKTVKTWDHFFVNLPPEICAHKADMGRMLGDFRATYDVMLRGLRDITIDSVSTVLELIAQNSLYRGEEQTLAVQRFFGLKRKFDGLSDAMARDLLCWSLVQSLPQSVSRMRNTAIGTLLVDLSEGQELASAVQAFEAKVAPANYKRPTALVTKAMVAQAQKTIEALGYMSALERRYATIEDITVNNVLFANRMSRQAMHANVFDTLSASIPEKHQNFEKVEEVGIQDFLHKILPHATSIELLVENRHAGNFVSLIAPSDPTAKNMFTWQNNFSWSYAGEVADSIKERVKKAGGNIDADFRASLSWFNYDDLDLHLREPTGFEIYFRQGKAPDRAPKTHGQLDVDMNAGHGVTRIPVENIVYPYRASMAEGIYTLSVHNFMKRESVDVGFEAEMEFDGSVFSFAYENAVKDQEHVAIAQFRYDHKTGVEIIHSLPSSQSSKTLWGITTQNFCNVNVVLLSPNHWDGHGVGNKHYFFMLDGCAHEGRTRGFYNEFLSAELSPHRKVLEVVGAKMQTEEATRQLSGLGFSSTQRNHVMCRVKGHFTRVVKILF